jgi:hypothetical protein
MSLIGIKAYGSKSPLYILTITLALFIPLVLSGCSPSDTQNKTSIASSTTTGSGTSGGSAASVVVTSVNRQVVTGGTTPITVAVTDSSGKRTDATITLTSSRGGTFFDGTSTTWIGQTIGGSLIVNFTAPTDPVTTEITATVMGTNIKGSVTITTTSNSGITITAITSDSTKGSITPSSQSVSLGGVGVFVLSPNTGYTASVTGTCGGTLNGNIFTTNPVTSSCTVIAVFGGSASQITIAASSSDSTKGTISPSSLNVDQGGVGVFVLSPAATHTIASVTGTCGGTLNISGNTFTTNPVTSNCTVIANFN